MAERGTSQWNTVQVIPESILIMLGGESNDWPMKTLLGCEWVETVAKVACLFFYTQGPWNHQIRPHLFQSDKVCAFHLSFSVSFPKLIAHGLEWM